MRPSILILLSALTIQLPCLSVSVFAEPARFWISPSATNPYWSSASDPDILQIDLYADSGQDASKDRLYIWAQPATNGQGNFKQLQNFTLDVVSTDPLIDFLDGPNGAIIENPGGDRFSSIRDSQQVYQQNPALELKTKSPNDIGPEPDKIIGLQGLNLTVPVPNVINEGIGPNCLNEAEGCVVTPQGPVWLIGSFSLQSMDMLGSADIHLQIGSAGINHLSELGDINESTSLTQVIFSATGEGPVYQAGGQSHNRQDTLPGDNPEVRVHISDKLVGDYAQDMDGMVNGADFLAWQAAAGNTINLPNRPFGVTGLVGQADLLALQVNYGKSITGGSATLVVPEPESLVFACSVLIICFSCRGFARVNGFGSGFQRIFTKAAKTNLRSSLRAAGALSLALVIGTYQQALAVIDVDPSGDGDTNVFTFTAGGPLLFTDPQTNHVALSDPFAVGHNFNQKGVLLVNGGSSITSNAPGDAHTLGTGIVIANVDPLAPTVGSTGILTVHGANSTVTSNNNLTVGVRGSGELNVWDGAVVNSNVTWLGYYSDTTGDATIWGTGSRWEPKELAVGYDGTGTIDIAGGGRLGYIPFVSGSTSYIGFGGNSDGTVTVDGSNSNFYGGELFRVGQAGTGTLNIRNGGTVVHNFNSGFNDYTPANGLVLGNNSGSSGTINVTGSNSSLTANKNLSVGRFGSGTLNVESGGRVTSNVSWIGYESSSTGTAMVTGNGSRWEPDELAIGVEGTGTLNVTNGGRVGYISPVSGSTSYIGFASTGEVTVDGSGSIFYGGEIFRVGQGGIGTLDIKNGGTVIHNFNSGLHQDFPENGLVLGNNLGSSGEINVNGSGSSLTADKNLSVGRYGSGTLNVQSGGSVTSNLTWLGYQPSATGTATLTGSGSNWVPKELVVGFQGEGTLNVNSGGRVGAASHVGGSKSTIGHASTGTATVSGPGSIFYGGETFVVGQQAGTGTLNVENGGAVVHNFNPNGPENDEYLFGTGIVIGNDAGATGTINVDGANSTLTSNKNLAVGGFGHGTLNVQSGGRVTSNVSWLGYHSGSTGTGTVTGSGSRWEPKELSVGFSGTGTLNVTSGGRLGKTSHVPGSTSYIGANSTGVVTVNGNGSTFYGNEAFAVGHVGNGTLNVTNGGSVVHKFNPAADAYSLGTGLVIGNNSGSTGTVNVIGANSTLTSNKNLALGGSTSGTLNVEAGGTVNSNISWLGYHPGSAGVATVTGAGSTWNPDELTVGLEGTGTITVQNGGRVGYDSYVFGSTSLIAYAANSTGQVTVDGAGSTFYGGRLFRVGQGGNGTVNITDGGTVIHSSHPTASAYAPANGLVLGNNGGSTGTINVTGANSSLTANKNLALGRFGNGTLNVEAGGTVNSNISWLGFEPGSTGTATVTGAGSQWSSSELFVGGNSSSSAGIGLLTVKDGGVVDVSGDLTIWANGTLKGNGEVVGNLINGGHIAPGNSPGILTIDGDYTQTSTGVLEIEVEGTGTAGTDYDQLRVSGQVSLGGTLHFDFTNNLGPTLGDNVTFIETFGGGEILAVPAGDVPKITTAGLDPLSNLAVRVTSNVGVGGTVEMDLVQAGNVTFDGTDPSTNWFTDMDWSSDFNPIAEDNTVVGGNVFVQVGIPQRVVVNNTIAGSTSVAQVRQLTVGDTNQSVVVEIETELHSATGDITIAENGGIELDGGVLSVTSARTVQVIESGMLAGSGTVMGSVEVGTVAGNDDATISPGMSTAGMEVGKLTIDGSYNQGSDGVFAVDITGDNSGVNHDFVDVSGIAVLDGTLMIDASTFAGLTNGQMYEILRADVAISGEFDDVVVTGAGDKYFKVIYEDGTVSPLTGSGELAASTAGGPSRIIVAPYDMGDVSGDGVVDNIDAQAFASAILDLGLDFNFSEGQIAGAIDLRNAFDFSKDRRIDLDDVAGFANLFSMANGVSIESAYQTLDTAFAQARACMVPEPGCLLYSIVGLLALGIHRPNRRSL